MTTANRQAQAVSPHQKQQQTMYPDHHSPAGYKVKIRRNLRSSTMCGSVPSTNHFRHLLEEESFTAAVITPKACKYRQSKDETSRQKLQLKIPRDRVLGTKPMPMLPSAPGQKLIKIGMTLQAASSPTTSGSFRSLEAFREQTIPSMGWGSHQVDRH
ncbi:hypothetical protein PG997_008138 [Apiospora hydei]|uniref:Uncharacterized protein n=1 Tax=Apiospora hydei TaxID=1337664 RepID=A0ABR1W9Z2_9PEZI